MSLIKMHVYFTCLDRMSASEESGPGRGTDGAHVVVVEDDAIVGQVVDVRGGNLVRPMEAYVVPTLRSLSNRLDVFGKNGEHKIQITT